MIKRSLAREPELTVLDVVRIPEVARKGAGDLVERTLDSARALVLRQGWEQTFESVASVAEITPPSWNQGVRRSGRNRIEIAPAQAGALLHRLLDVVQEVGEAPLHGRLRLVAREGRQGIDAS
eukprot:CAMPEP_0115666632 /NCGR_PEP_ID=MMETSP0272-20121206/49517_1 /TAXON_ID=71861 /ORGANISM="Scrippsiella trochoidea, Strain CCMP3099" /LENGTH=122 /DNA_ID=CAMNT_0003105139 /DNA_START=539 /DNA_END=907 /DNA_ORIENTATION=-